MDSPQDPLRKIPTKHAPEAQSDIGSILKAARNKKSQTIETVAQQTRIPKKYLDALENNRFDEFPAAAYLRGFLKSYCDYLELDFEPLWRQATHAPEAAAPAPAAPAASAKPEPKPEVKPTPKAESAKPATATAPKKEASKPQAQPKKAVPPPAAKPSHDGAPAKSAGHGGHGHDAHGHAPAAPAGERSSTANAAAIVLLIGALGVFGSFWALHERQPSTGGAGTAAPAELQRFKPQTEGTLVAELRDEAWLSVVIDGKPVYEGKVPKNSRQEWKLTKAAALRTSNPDALKLTLNGSPVKLPAPDASSVYRIEAP